MRGPPSGGVGGGRSGERGGMTPGSLQAASVNEPSNDAVLIEPIMVAATCITGSTYMWNSAVGTTMREYVQSMHGKSGPVKNVQGVTF